MIFDDRWGCNPANGTYPAVFAPSQPDAAHKLFQNLTLSGGYPTQKLRHAGTIVAISAIAGVSPHGRSRCFDYSGPDEENATVALRIVNARRLADGTILPPPAGERGHCYEFCLHRLPKLDDDGLSFVGMILQKIKYVSVYVQLNPPDSIPMAHRPTKYPCRWTRVGPGEGFSGANLRHARWLLVDIDPIREEKGTSATAEERAAAERVRNSIYKLFPRLVRSSLSGSSGNGFYILIRTDESDPAVRRRILRTLDLCVSTHEARVDLATFDLARIAAIPGTLKSKGEHTSSRPWRWVTLDHGYSEPITPVNLPAWLDELEALAPEAFREHSVYSTATDLGVGRSALLTDAERRRSVRRAKAWLEHRPVAVAGNRGHACTFAAVLSVVRKFTLCEADLGEVFATWNSRCEPPWGEADLLRKFREAVRVVGVDSGGWRGSLDLKTQFVPADLDLGLEVAL